MSFAVHCQSNEINLLISQMPFSFPSILGLKDIIVNDILDIQIIIQHLSFGGKFTTEAVTYILQRASQVFKQEPNVVEINSPCTVIGDTHGQFYDLLNFFSTVSSGCYVCLGDYVDRGDYGVELFLLLCSLKVVFPNQFIILRGNHETRSITTQNQFKNECLMKYSEDVYNSFISTFECLPLCCLISTLHSRYFCVHGGISDRLSTIDDINKLNRFCEPVRDSPLEDLLWSDPLNEDEIFSVSIGDTSITSHLNSCQQNHFPFIKQSLKMYFNDQAINRVVPWFETTFVPNWVRRYGHKIGYSALKQFNEKNNITTIIRGHQYVNSGYQCMYYLVEETPLLCTVFSAPNYMGECCNVGGYIQIKDDSFITKTFKTVTKRFVVKEYILNFGETLLFEKIVGLNVSC
ncbi:serine/threonine protein phosphatase PP2A-1 catalytic subunit, putative [Entamoeba dispar SAW760]|uniref:Serine/threonine-protein phosphatase n=1 Tax=Entamoeba dispar (strain ATCC PRA-260 / SAW760) TaxID=370354 RepID=B0E596_ENTDS|nr:serine/threonine protein phosphatase PP2A-1 catalytic subunit, putative [Entamoeba dispar SAW760]EDR30300.1 serine/threonine protein phosphatase PP2A-1 catalytic subunit, putative [Entamoeba dispar SAW760]|eukprot:EDR30300.1 serine/threonine protein phosphatase PP2A-1 catalytic subunit, putative [Entamoeba dispar SAW760]